MSAARTPFLRDEPSTEDLLDRATMLKLVARCVENVSTPSCVAIYGPWGSGKTTFLTQLERALIVPSEEGRAAAASAVVTFSPWLYERQGDVLAGLMLQLTREIRKRNGGARADDLKRLAQSVVAPMLGRGFSALVAATVGIPPSATAAALQAGASMFDKLDGEDLSQEARASFKKLIDELVETLGSAGDRIVIILDDLDRCLPGSVLEIIESTKLVLCASGAPVVFVMALDREVVSNAVRSKLPEISRYAGETYLEKIFDLSFEIPPPSPAAIAKAVQTYLASLPGEADFARVAKGSNGATWSSLLAGVAADPVFANPRLLKRGLTKVALMAQGGVFEACGDLQASDVRRLFAWILGSERYRAFRTFMFAAPGADLRALHQASTGQKSPTELKVSALVAELVEQPLFKRYYNDLLGFEPLDANKAATCQRSERVTVGSTDSLGPLYAENLMRRCGL